MNNPKLQKIIDEIRVTAPEMIAKEIVGCDPLGYDYNVFLKWQDYIKTRNKFVLKNEETSNQSR